MCRTSCGSQGGNEGSWQCITEHRGKAAGEILTVEGCDTSLFCLPSQYPLKNVHINPDDVCTGMIPN